MIFYGIIAIALLNIHLSETNDLPCAHATSMNIRADDRHPNENNSSRSSRGPDRQSPDNEAHDSVMINGKLKSEAQSMNVSELNLTSLDEVTLTGAYLKRFDASYNN